MRFGTKRNPEKWPQPVADWVIIKESTHSKVKIEKRYLCQSCVLLCEEWNGEKYTIEQQLKDAKGVLEIDYGV
jgi:hypothetical protein